MRNERFNFPNARGEQLAAALDLPDAVPHAYALFAHCFTCGKDVLAGKRIAERLTEAGIAVLRFDFTGLGASEGEFANTSFSSNVADLVAAADHLRKTYWAPDLLIGHSLGGAAILAAAEKIPEARAVVTIGACSDPAHVAHMFKDKIDDIRREGEVEVKLVGRPFRIRREFLDDIAAVKLDAHIAKLGRPLLIFHAPGDEYVGIEHASHIFLTAKHPKSFVSLAGADHLLTRKSDARYVGHVIAAWAERYLDIEADAPVIEAPETGSVRVRETRASTFQQDITIGKHHIVADEPLSVGGLDTGPNPYDLLLAGLGACTSMTLRLYAERKQLPLDRVSVRLSHTKIHAEDCASCETKTGMIDRIDRVLTLEGALDAAQRLKLLEIADKCPVHRTLGSEIDIRTFEEPAK